MTPGPLSCQREFTQVPSHGSIFVYMIPPQNVMLAGVTPVCIQPSYVVLEQEFHSGMKFVCKCKTTTHIGVKSVCRWTGMGSACKMIAILNHTCIYFINMKCIFK